GEVMLKAKEIGCNLYFIGTQTDHDLLDDIVKNILSKLLNDYFIDYAVLIINNFSILFLINKAVFVIALYGEKYKQCNTTMDANTVINLGKPLIIIRPESAIHALKELSNKAIVIVETVDQAVEVIKYIYK